MTQIHFRLCTVLFPTQNTLQQTTQTKYPFCVAGERRGNYVSLSPRPKLKPRGRRAHGGEPLPRPGGTAAGLGRRRRGGELRGAAGASGSRQRRPERRRGEPRRRAAVRRGAADDAEAGSGGETGAADDDGGGEAGHGRLRPGGSGGNGARRGSPLSSAVPYRSSS